MQLKIVFGILLLALAATAMPTLNSEVATESSDDFDFAAIDSLLEENDDITSDDSEELDAETEKEDDEFLNDNDDEEEDEDEDEDDEEDVEEDKAAAKCENKPKTVKECRVCSRASFNKCVAPARTLKNTCKKAIRSSEAGKAKKACIKKAKKFEDVTKCFKDVDTKGCRKAAIAAAADNLALGAAIRACNTKAKACRAKIVDACKAETAQIKDARVKCHDAFVGASVNCHSASRTDFTVCKAPIVKAAKAAKAAAKAARAAKRAAARAAAKAAAAKPAPAAAAAATANGNKKEEEEETDVEDDNDDEDESSDDSDMDDDEDMVE